MLWFDIRFSLWVLVRQRELAPLSVLLISSTHTHKKKERAKKKKMWRSAEKKKEKLCTLYISNIRVYSCIFPAISFRPGPQDVVVVVVACHWHGLHLTIWAISSAAFPHCAELKHIKSIIFAGCFLLVHIFFSWVPSQVILNFSLFSFFSLFCLLALQFVALSCLLPVVFASLFARFIYVSVCVV